MQLSKEENFSPAIGLLFKEETSIRSVAFYGAETWTLRTEERKYLERFEISAREG